MILREWGPVAACSGLVCAIGVWLGLTGCTLPYRPYDLDPGPEPAHVPDEFLTGGYGLIRITTEFLDLGDHWEPTCTEGSGAFRGQPMIDAERVVFGPGSDDVIWLGEIELPSFPVTESVMALKSARADGTEIGAIPLSFRGSFDIDPGTWIAYVAEENGPRVAIADIRMGTADIVTPMSGGSALQLTGDLRVVKTSAGDTQVWIADGVGDVVVLDANGAFVGRVQLEPMANVAIDHAAGSGLVHAITDGGLWEIDIDTRIATRVLDVAGGRTISAEASDDVGFTAGTGDSFVAYFRPDGDRSAREVGRFDMSGSPVAQLTVQGRTFVAVSDSAAGGADIVVCPNGAAIYPDQGGRRFARTVQTDVPPEPPSPPPPPPSEPVQITIATTPVTAPIVVDGQTFPKQAKVLWKPGSMHQVSVPASIVVDTVQFNFIGWQHGDPKPDITITAPAVPTDFVAVYAPKGQ